MAFENLKTTGITYFLTKLKDYFVQIKDAVRTVNGAEPDANGDVAVSTVQFAQNLQSESANINAGTFIERTAGGDASIENGNAWLLKVYGNMSRTGYVPESLTMTVNAMAQATPITATINRDTFVAAVSASGTITLTYTTAWSADPATYGVTVTNTPTAGDQIIIEYVKEERGAITQSDPQAFIETGWNLYNHTNGYARVLRYSDTYDFGISGTYTSIAFSSTLGGVRSTITVTDGKFSVPSDGYVWVTGGNATSTAIWMTWSDWTEQANGGVFAAYAEQTVDLSSIMETYFPYGLLSSGTVRDEIDLNVGQVINRVERMAYSEENRATADASGREYIFDEDYIYIAKATPTTTSVSLSGGLTASDHGIEIVSNTSLAVEIQVMYGANLKNKLERDVLMISQQTLTAAQQAQVQANIGMNTAMKGLNSYTGANLDNAKTPGMYWVTPTTTSGLPSGVSANYAQLNVFAAGSNAILQQFSPYDGTNGVRRTFFRIYINSQWYAWSMFRENNFGTYSGALNNLKAEGTYWVTMSIITGYPSGVSSSASGIIEVIDSGYSGFGNRLVQKLYVWVGANSAITSYYRMLVNGTWTPWTA